MTGKIRGDRSRPVKKLALAKPSVRRLVRHRTAAIIVRRRLTGSRKGDGRLMLSALSVQPLDEYLDHVREAIVQGQIHGELAAAF